MKPNAVVAVLWMAGCGLFPQFVMTQPLHEDNHVLEMTVLCDSFEMIGDFCLEFNNARRYDIKYSRNDPTLVNFKYLVIDANTIFIDDKRAEGDIISIDRHGDGNTKFRIENFSQTTLKILDEKNRKDTKRELWIKRIEGSEGKDAEISFEQLSGRSYASFEEDSIIYLENSLEMILELEGDFQVQVIDENDDIVELIRNEEYGVGPNLNEAQISFFGFLSVESPEVPSVDSLCLGFEFNDNVDQLGLGNGQAIVRSEAKSAQESSENQFIEVMEDGFRIDMTKEFYKSNDYLEDFHIKNIRRMSIDEIRESDGRLMIKAGTTSYIGETLFPKIRVTTRYFSADTQSEEEESYLVELTNSEATRNEVKFLEGNQYKVEIHIQKLVKDDIEVDLEDRNCHCFVSYDGEKILKGIDLDDLEFRYEYKFIVVPGCSHLSGPINCFTKVFYRKKNEEYGGKLPFCETRKFSAVIKVGIHFSIEPEESEPRSIDESGTLAIEKDISLISETSSPVTVRAFLVLEKGFEVEGGTPYVSGKLRKDGDPLPFKVDVKPPPMEKTRESYEIKILVFYKMAESDYYILYLPDATKDETVVIDVVVERSEEFFYKHPNIGDYIVSFLAGVSATTIVSIIIHYIKKQRRGE